MSAHVAAADEFDKLVPDPEVCREFGISAMTLWRWDRDPELGFPPPVKIRKRKFRHRSAIEEFKRQLLQRALADWQHSRAAH
jgi:predicted DNA-binding transcriptional regulator AlpA